MSIQNRNYFNISIIKIPVREAYFTLLILLPSQYLLYCECAFINACTCVWWAKLIVSTAFIIASFKWFFPNKWIFLTVSHVVIAECWGLEQFINCVYQIKTEVSTSKGLEKTASKINTSDFLSSSTEHIILMMWLLINASSFSFSPVSLMVSYNDTN